MTDRLPDITPPLDLLESVLRTSAGVAARVGPADLSRPTPCDELDVQGVLEHLIGWQLVFAACAAGREPPLADGSPTYRASEDIAGALGHASSTLLASLRERADESITLPYRGSTLVHTLHAELIAESVIHTWDLAAALGWPVDFSDQIIAAAHDGLTLLLGESFAPTAFGVPAAVDPGATEVVRLVVRSGRSPHWPE